MNFAKTPAPTVTSIESLTTAFQEQEKTNITDLVLETNDDEEFYRPFHPDLGKFGGQTIINFQPILSNSVGDVNAVVSHIPENDTTGLVQLFYEIYSISKNSPEWPFGDAILQMKNATRNKQILSALGFVTKNSRN